MEFSINRNVFLESLVKANKVIDAKNINPVLGGVLLETSLETVTLISTSGSLSYKSTLTAKNADLEVKAPGKILIKTKYIIEMIRRLEEEFITLIVVEDYELKIKTKKTEFNIGILDPEDYPLIGFKERGVEITLDSQELKKTISQTFVSIYEWNKKIALTGMNFRFAGNKFFISTTDTFRISQKVITLDNNDQDLNLNVTIPYKTIVELPKLLDNIQDLKMVIADGYITFVMDDSLFQTTVIEGQYPNVEAAFPKEFGLTLKVNSKILLKSLNRADLPSEDGLSPVINLNISKEKLILKANITEIGNFEEEFFDFETNSQNQLMINFNSKYLIEAIRTFDSDFIELNFVDEKKPLVIQQVGDDSLKQVIMPTYITN